MTETTQDDTTQNITKKSSVTRREFLRRSFLTAGVVGLGALGINLTNRDRNQDEVSPEQRETLLPSDHTVFVDMAPGYDKQALMRELLGSQFDESIDLTNPEINTNITELLGGEDDRAVATLLTHQMLRSRAGHGEMMIQKYLETLSDLGIQTESPTILPLQEAFTNGVFSRDQLGNPTIRFEVDSQRIGDQLESHFAQNPNVKCVNLSLQIGTQEVKQMLRQVIPIQKTGEVEVGYEEETNTYFFESFIATDVTSLAMHNGILWPHRTINGESVPLNDDELYTEQEFEELNRRHEQEVMEEYARGEARDQVEESYRTEITEAYNPRFARENLQKLVTLCRRFPDKVFTVSGGNENSFFYEIRQEMEANGEWANNLIIAAGETDKCDGADVYVQDFRFGRTRDISSSESAAKMNALLSLVADRNISLSQPTEVLARFSEEITFDTHQGNSRQALALDPDVFRPELSATVQPQN